MCCCGLSNELLILCCLTRLFHVKWSFTVYSQDEEQVSENLFLTLASADYKHPFVLRHKEYFNAELQLMIISIICQITGVHQNNTHTPIHTVKELLIAAIVPPVYTGHVEIPL